MRWTKSDIRRWMKRHDGYAWFKYGPEEQRISLAELEKLSPRDASDWFDYERNMLNNRKEISNDIR